MRAGDARSPVAGGGGTPASWSIGDGRDGVHDAVAKRQREKERRNGARKRRECEREQWGKAREGKPKRGQGERDRGAVLREEGREEGKGQTKSRS